MLLSPSSNILADKPQLAQSLFVMICASSWALHTRWPLVERKFLLQLKYYEATTFVESYFLGSYQWETTLYISLNCFCIHHAKSYTHFAERDDASGFLERRHSMLLRVTFTSVNFMAVDQQMQLNHTLWSKYAASTLQDDEHYAHSAYFQGNYQRKTAFSVCFLEFFLQSSSKELWRTSRKDMTL